MLAIWLVIQAARQECTTMLRLAVFAMGRAVPVPLMGGDPE